jgi:hypothetical protein
VGGAFCALRCFKLEMATEEAFDIYIFIMGLTEIAITGAIYFILIVWLFGFEPTFVVGLFFAGGFIIKLITQWIKMRRTRHIKKKES